MEVITQPKFELAYNDSAVHRFKHYTTRTQPKCVWYIRHRKKGTKISHSPCYPPIWLRVMGYLSWSTTIPRSIPPKLLPHHLQYPVKWLSQLKSVNRERSTASRSCYRSPSYDGQHTSSGLGIIACLGSYCAICSLLVVAIEGNQRCDTWTAWKHLLVPVTWSAVAENRQARCLSTNHVVSSFENTCKITVRHKRLWRKNHSNMPSSPTSYRYCNRVY